MQFAPVPVMLGRVATAPLTVFVDELPELLEPQPAAISATAATAATPPATLNLRLRSNMCAPSLQGIADITLADASG
jgi:hypothetical protein